MASKGTHKNSRLAHSRMGGTSGVRAELAGYNQSPRKVRLVTDLIKGKRVEEALVALQFLPKRASEPIAKLIKSAVANARVKGEDPMTLKVKSITVDSAGQLVRFMPRAQGRATPIHRRRSLVRLVLSI